MSNTVIKIRQGRDIRLAGAASPVFRQAGLPPKAAVQPPDFRGIRGRLLVKEGDSVKVGTPVLGDKNDPGLHLVSPASGKVAAVNRGEKRVLLEIVIETDGRQEAETFPKLSSEQIKNLSRRDAVEHLSRAGLWPALRQRPFSKIASRSDTPKSIFVQALSTEPLALDISEIFHQIPGSAEAFQTGLEVLTRLTDGTVHVCAAADATADVLKTAPAHDRIRLHHFSGPHPAGNVSTLIHYIDPIQKGDIVWYIGVEDVIRIGKTLTEGAYWPQKFVAVAGEGIEKEAREYKETVIGAPVSFLAGGKLSEKHRYISGSILSGRDVGLNGHLRYFDNLLTAVPAGGQREFLGWLSPGWNKFTFSRAFLSALRPCGEVSLDTSKKGSDRAIVLNHIYDKYVPLDIMTYFLIRAVIGGDIEEAERMGILECDEEDFALCSFACPSKTDIGGIIRDGLDVIEKEG